MYDKVYHATHPDMMAGATNDELRDRYLISGLFEPGRISLNYSHNERMVLGGATPTDGALTLPTHSEPPSMEGKPFLHARELGVVNTGGAGTITVDGEAIDMAVRAELERHTTTEAAVAERRQRIQAATAKFRAAARAGRILTDSDLYDDLGLPK